MNVTWYGKQLLCSHKGDPAGGFYERVEGKEQIDQLRAKETMDVNSTVGGRFESRRTARFQQRKSQGRE